jgi:hypothetical protein
MATNGGRYTKEHKLNATETESERVADAGEVLKAYKGSINDRKSAVVVGKKHNERNRWEEYNIHCSKHTTVCCETKKGLEAP